MFDAILRLKTFDAARHLKNCLQRISILREMHNSTFVIFFYSLFGSFYCSFCLCIFVNLLQYIQEFQSDFFFGLPLMRYTPGNVLERNYLEFEVSPFKQGSSRSNSGSTTKVKAIVANAVEQYSRSSSTNQGSSSNKCCTGSTNNGSNSNSCSAVVIVPYPLFIT